MAEQEKKFIIEIFRKKDAEELSAALADTEGKLNVGSAAALTAADACAMALRAAGLTSGGPDTERMAYISRNLESLRGYMVYLIDEDVKGLNILRRALKEGDRQKIDAARQPACAISNEVICQMANLIELLDELSAGCTAEAAPFLGSAVHMALAALQSARLFAVGMSGQSTDETFRFITRRENEITWERLRPLTERILSRAEEALRREN